MGILNLIIKQDEEEIEAGEVLVDGTIGGNRYRFILDTGAARTNVIYDDYTAMFNCIEKWDSFGLFAKCSDDLIMVPCIELGPISKKDFMLVRRAENTTDIRNLIGMDILKDYCCHFSFEKNIVVVDAEDESIINYTFQELFLGNRFHPYIDINFGKLKAKAVWDTGAGMTIVDMNFIKKHPAFFQEVGQASGTDSTGTEMETPMFIMASTIIGNNAFPPHKVVGVDLSQVNCTTEMPMDLILGYSTLRKANWIFDFPRKKWAVSKILDVK